MKEMLATGLVFLTLLELAVCEWHWAYDGDSGPPYWLNHHDKCNGRKQSPIDIPLSETVFDSSHAPIAFKDYEADHNAITYKLKNNGHAVQVDVTGGSHGISGGNLPGQYNLGQFHFHWGQDNRFGSEHLINGKQFPLEMHLVHYNSKYSGIAEAKEKDDGLAVVGVMFEVGSAKHPGMDAIVKNLKDIQYKGQSKTIPPFSLAGLLPSEPERYFRYSGSLTTPTCDETVVWTVLEKPNTISQDQVDAFRETVYQGSSGDKSHKLVDNYRPPQPLFGRTIYISFTPETQSSSNRFTVSLACVHVGFILNYFL